MFRKSYEAYSNLSRDFSDKMIFIDKSRYLHYGRGFSRSEYSTRFLFAFRTVWYPFLPWGAAHSFRNLKKSVFIEKQSIFRIFGSGLLCPQPIPGPTATVASASWEIRFSQGFPQHFAGEPIVNFNSRRRTHRERGVISSVT